MKKSAFTLAEVLITLAIIGVIAAISVPSLIQKTNQAELITAWKKTYATISQAYDKMLFDNGSAGFCATNDITCLRNTFSNYMKVVKSCDTGANDNCWAQHTWNDGSSDTSYNTKAGVILNSGTSITFFSYSRDCTGTIDMIAPLTNCAAILVDVNGFKGPNAVGKDVFGIHLFPDSAVPYGAGSPYIDNYSEGKTRGDNAKYGFGLSAINLYKQK